MKLIIQLFFRYIDFLKGYSSPLLDVSFTAERSIQDAIIELSNAETSTVLISYSVMFVYVSLALGKMTSLKTFLVMQTIKILKN